jgi:monovalent cation/proton antiporter MnhG/PhaG subunit
MTENLIVDILLAVAVAAELLACIGVLVMRSVFDRLHFVAAGTALGPFLILAALLVREGLGSQTLNAIVAVAFLFLANPVLVHATGRAARRLDYGEVGARADERER